MMKDDVKPLEIEILNGLIQEALRSPPSTPRRGSVDTDIRSTVTNNSRLSEIKEFVVQQIGRENARWLSMIGMIIWVIIKMYS